MLTREFSFSANYRITQHYRLQSCFTNLINMCVSKYCMRIIIIIYVHKFMMDLLTFLEMNELTQNHNEIFASLQVSARRIVEVAICFVWFSVENEMQMWDCTRIQALNQRNVCEMREEHCHFNDSLSFCQGWMLSRCRLNLFSKEISYFHCCDWCFSIITL